jgi:uncharacterized membrane protein (UPF0127 family)
MNKKKKAPFKRCFFFLIFVFSFQDLSPIFKSNTLKCQDLFLSSQQSGHYFLKNQVSKNTKKRILIKIKDITLNLEVAETALEREKGLMYRSRLTPYSGMLFVFEDEKNISMWMKNTSLKLDMIWISENGKVVYTFYNTIPFSEDIISSPYPAKYVIELAHPLGKVLKLTKGSYIKELDTTISRKLF